MIVMSSHKPSHAKEEKRRYLPTLNSRHKEGRIFFGLKLKIILFLRAHQHHVRRQTLRKIFALWLLAASILDLTLSTQPWPPYYRYYFSSTPKESSHNHDNPFLELQPPRRHLHHHRRHNVRRARRSLHRKHQRLTRAISLYARHLHP